MRAAGQGGARPGELASALLDEVESKKHRRDPFGDRYVALATSEFGGNAEDGGRAAVEAVTTNVHVRVELIRSMKNTLLKQTQEAVKRSTQLGPPPARQRLGTRARQAAAAAAAAEAADAEAQLTDTTGDETSNDTMFCCDGLHHELDQLLSGGGLAPEAATNLATAQEALGAGRDGTRLPPGELSLPVQGELAPPPFDDFVQELFGAHAEASQPTAAAAAAGPLPPAKAAGLAAAVRALQLHTAELEGRGLLQVAGTAAIGWLSLDSSEEAPNAGQFERLPAYLQAGEQAGGGQPVLQQQQQQGLDSRYQRWPTPPAGAAVEGAAQGHDANQEADEVPDWGALEGEAFVPTRRTALQLNLQAQLQCWAAAGGVLVTFDEDPAQQAQQAQQQQAQQAGRNLWQAGGQQAQQAPQAQQGQQGQARLSDIWECSDGVMDPWMDVEDGGSHVQQQQRQSEQQQAVAGALHMPTVASRPGRQQVVLSLSQPQPVQQQTAFAEEGIEDEEWDEGELEQVAALEQQALQEREQAPPGGQPPQQQTGKRHVPVFRGRAFQQTSPAGTWPAESIEDADSDEEGEQQAAEAGTSQAVAAARCPAAGAVPQLGRRGGLLLAGRAAAAGQAMAMEPVYEGGSQPPAAAPSQQPGPGLHASTAAGASGQPAVMIDFSAIDVEALRPSVLLRQQTGGRPKWRPVFDPEQLLLPPLRSALQPPQGPTAQHQAAGGNRWQMAGARGCQLATHAASALLAGITAADLEEWDDWGDEEAAVPDDAAAALDGAGFECGSRTEAAGQWRSHRQPQQQQQQQQQLMVGWDEPVAATQEQGPAAAAAPWAPIGASAPAAAASPAAPSVRFQPTVELAFDYDDDADSEREAGQARQQQQQQQSQSVHGTSQPQSQQQVRWPFQTSGINGSLSQLEGGNSAWQQDFGWQQAPQQAPQQHSELVLGLKAAGDPWAGLEEATGQQGSQDNEHGQPAVHLEYPFAQSASGQAAGAATAVGADAEDPWAALADDVEGPAVDGLAGSSGWFSLQAAQAVVSTDAAAVVAMAEDPPAGDCAAGNPLNCWALDVDWEDAGLGVEEQLPPAAQQQQQQQQLAAGVEPSSSPNVSVAEDAATAALGGALEWEYDEPEQATVLAAAVGTGSLAARLAALGVLDPAVPAVAAAAAGKRRHEQIGVQIIQALLEERRRARVDLQPLLQQLGSHLAQALGSGGGSSPSGDSSSEAAEGATLTAVRQACLDSGGPVVQASMQRYLVALLTAAHHHNSGAVAAALAADGSSAAAPSAATAPLAAALAGKQLVLHAPAGATDILIEAA